MTSMYSCLAARRAAFVALVVLAAPIATGGAQARQALTAPSIPAGVLEIVAGIRRADYEGDRPALARLEQALAKAGPGTAPASRIHYWRGFALWRRAINGFNEMPLPADLRGDLEGAVARFEAALAAEPQFVDALAGKLSSVGYLMFLVRTDQTALDSLLATYRPFIESARSAAPNHPRFIWVMGPSMWAAASRAPAAEVATRQAAVIAEYERGLAMARAAPVAGREPLDPAWGEAELLMNLAWSHANKTTPDPVLAERYATEALAIVPYWHYVRDILLPQIRAARGRR